MRCRVEIDVEEILGEIPLDELFEEVGDKRLKAALSKRRIGADVFKSNAEALTDLFFELRRAIRFRDLGELTAILDAYEHPKWKSPEVCEKEFLAAKVVQ